VKSFLQVINSGNSTPLQDLPPDQARQVLVDVQDSVTVDVSGIDVQEVNITQDGMNIKIYIVTPAGNNSTLPVFMFFHGGGWVLGDFPTHKRFIRDLVWYSGLAAVHVEYSRSPEVQYPVALDECYAATKWISENGAQYNLDGSNLAVVGNSAGGNLAAAVALKAKAMNGPSIKFQLLFWPVTNADFNDASYQQFAEQRFLTKEMMIWFWDSYTTNTTERSEIYASPLQATLDDLSGLPPAYVQTAENDVLRDEGEDYARKLDLAGVDVTLVRMQGMIHDYGLLNPLANITAVQAALRAGAAEIVYWLCSE